ncbi:MAG: hypothetical protein ABI534_11410 [Chloroflexota bacterium]
MPLTKVLGAAGALIVSALIGGTLIGSVLAGDETDPADGSGGFGGSRGAYCDTFLDAFATELGVTRNAVADAGKTAANAAIDAAIAAGDLSEERATALRERVDAAEGDGCGLLRAGWVRGFGHGLARGFAGGDVFGAAAEALGIQGSELIEQLRDAGSLETLAEQLGVSYDEVKSSVVASVQADLDAAVEEGLSQDRADSAIEHLGGWLDGGGEIGGVHVHRGEPRLWGSRS